MTPTHITRKRGDTYPMMFTVLSDGVPLDITSATFLLTVDPSSAPADETNNLFSLVGNVVDGPNGILSFPISEGEADHIGYYFYDLQMVDVAGIIRTIQNGKFDFVQDITKAMS